VNETENEHKTHGNNISINEAPENESRDFSMASNETAKLKHPLPTASAEVCRNIQFIFHFTTKTNNKKMYLKGNFPSLYTYTHMVHIHFFLSPAFLAPSLHYGPLAIKFSERKS
jgi:hypothetical protein